MFFVVGIVLLSATCLTMGMIVRDVLPHLEPKEREYFRAWFHNWGTWKFSMAIRRVWDQHRSLFPKSRKRLAFGALLLVLLLSPGVAALLGVVHR
jgi:hypothetical protein